MVILDPLSICIASPSDIYLLQIKVRTFCYINTINYLWEKLYEFSSKLSRQPKLFIDLPSKDSLR